MFRDVPKKFKLDQNYNLIYCTYYEEQINSNDIISQWLQFLKL